MASVIGKNVKISLFGESHGDFIGIVIDGLKAGIKIDEDQIREDLLKRRPDGIISTTRIEEDDFQIVSGYFNNYTTGTPLTIIILNNNTVSKDYKPNILRPGHADYTAFLKYDGYQDYRGGGHFSGRLTAPLVIAGSICKQILLHKGIMIGSHIKQIYDTVDSDFSVNKKELENQVNKLSKMTFATLSPLASEKMQEAITNAKKDNDSVGGIIETAIVNLQGGIGEPFFDSLESVLSHYMFSIPAIKGIEFGKGFEFASMMGSKANDSFTFQDTIKTKTNNNGGINGGISNGMPIIFRTVIKPTPSISKEQETVDLLKNQNTTLKLKGRHDPCIVQRARIVIDSLSAIAILDMCVQRYGYVWME